MKKRFEKFIYIPDKRVCCSKIIILIVNNRIRFVRFSGGCPGLTKTITTLIQDKAIWDVIALLKGIECENRGTSCADQLCSALEGYLYERRHRFGRN